MEEYAKKVIRSINPYNQEVVGEYPEMCDQEIGRIIEQCNLAWTHWKKVPFAERSLMMHRAADVLRSKKDLYATLITLEMGKLYGEALAEIEKCAWACDHYADHTEAMLADEYIATEARKSMAVFQPIGPVLAIMPWNYPFWQTFRFAAPALMAGNTGLLKHASNVQGCALAIESVFREAGFPEHVFRTLVISSSKAESVIGHPLVKAVTLTGSEDAGRKVASLAGRFLKKSVLELGGSDPFIVLEDADLENAAQTGVKSRMLTSGQTCISAKRFIVVEQVADLFIEKMLAEMGRYIPGDPMQAQTTLAPLSKRSFAEEVHQQVFGSLANGARCLVGGQLPDNGCFYPATLVYCASRDVPVMIQETFGPVAAIHVVSNETEAIEAANDTLFGLGASLWTQDFSKAERLAKEIEAGAVFVNQLVKSDPRMPFGGIKNSGFGRELSSYGIKEFCNIKSIWIE